MDDDAVLVDVVAEVSKGDADNDEDVDMDELVEVGDEANDGDDDDM